MFVVEVDAGSIYQLTVFFFNDTATTEIYTLSLHDALPILRSFLVSRHGRRHAGKERSVGQMTVPGPGATSRHARLPTALPALLLVVAMLGWAVPAGAADTPKPLTS